MHFARYRVTLYKVATDTNRHDSTATLDTKHLHIENPCSIQIMHREGSFVKIAKFCLGSQRMHAASFCAHFVISVFKHCPKSLVKVVKGNLSN